MAQILQPTTFDAGTQKSYSIFSDADVAHDTAVAVKASAGRVKWVSVLNKHATEAGWLLFYNAAVGDITEGTTVPDFYIGFGSIAAGAVNMHINLVFNTAISIACSAVPIGNGALNTDPAVAILYT